MHDSDGAFLSDLGLAIVDRINHFVYFIRKRIFQAQLRFRRDP
jgi:hypothetical protein